MIKSHTFPVEYSALHVKFTKNKSPNRTYNPPSEYIKGKVRDLEVWWGRMDYSDTSDQFVIDVYPRLSTVVFGEKYGYLTLTKKELGNIVPQYGDVLWVWSWDEERIGRGIVPRVHIEVESRILTKEEKDACFELAKELEKDLLNVKQTECL